MPVTVDDISAARLRIRQYAVHTPLIRNDALDAETGAKVFVKPENLQVTGSFKMRGATNRIAQMTPSELARGVVAFSSGNHAQGVARAARILGTSATIVMPQDSPTIKLRGVQNDGAKIVTYDRDKENREAIAAALAEETGATVIPSYDDADIIAGQGTVGAEIANDLRVLGVTPDHFVCCAGGGGLIAGSSLALRHAFGAIQCWTAEPIGHDDWARSIENGKIQTNAPGFRSFCDAILTPQPGDIPFAVGHHHLAGGFAVSDAEVRHAMRFAFEHLKLVVEPGGAVALAAALRGLPDAFSKQAIVLVLSGGNVDPGVFAEVLTMTD